MVITFVGHSTGVPDLTEKIRSEILSRVSEGEPTVFYCGGYGEFDLLCARVCRGLKEVLPASETVLVTPYLSEARQRRDGELVASGLYDSVVYPPLEKVPPRLAILKRNEWMVDRADLIVAYVTLSFGGAARTLAYGKRKGKKIVSLADFPENSGKEKNFGKNIR